LFRRSALKAVRGDSSFKAYQAIAESNAWSRAELPGINAHVVEVPGVGREEEYQRHFLNRPEVLSAEFDRVLAPGALVGSSVVSFTSSASDNVGVSAVVTVYR